MLPGTELRKRFKALFLIAGSLWFATVIMILFLVSMACATVFESTHGTEQAMVNFYKSMWFVALLLLLGINIFSAMVSRYPFSRRQIGFVLTHSSILVILLGALVTKHFGIEGQMAVGEGQTVWEFPIQRETLTVVRQGTQVRSTADMPFKVISLDNLQIKIEKNLSDSTMVQQVLDDNPVTQTAIEVSLSESGRDNPIWIFANSPSGVASEVIRYQEISDQKELNRVLNPPPTTKPSSQGIVDVGYKGSAFKIPLEESMNKAVKIGNTGLSLRVLRYMPHATVGAKNQITNLSDKPVNPAIEVEITGREGTEKRLAFARFPDFSSMHQKKEIFAGLKITFLQTVEMDQEFPIEIVSDSDRQIYVRFHYNSASIPFQKIIPGTPLPTPWAGQKFTILRRFDHARTNGLVVPVNPVRPDRQPAILVKIESPKQTSELWLQKNSPTTSLVDGRKYEFIYQDKGQPLGFGLTLDRFKIGYYPGGHQPRSFESHVTVQEANTGLTQSQVISMNHPMSYGGYTLYQSSYNQGEGKTVSVLSVSRDPGQPIVFIGYFGVMTGMLLVLIRKRRQEN
ncbi:MAG: cytochrome c biogenesis protein ResB [Phycisphaerae bacterium]